MKGQRWDTRVQTQRCKLGKLRNVDCVLLSTAVRSSAAALRITEMETYVQTPVQIHLPAPLCSLLTSHSTQLRATATYCLLLLSFVLCAQKDDEGKVAIEDWRDAVASLSLFSSSRVHW